MKALSPNDAYPLSLLAEYPKLGKKVRTKVLSKLSNEAMRIAFALTKFSGAEGKVAKSSVSKGKLKLNRSSTGRARKAAKVLSESAKM